LPRCVIARDVASKTTRIARLQLPSVAAGRSAPAPPRLARVWRAGAVCMMRQFSCTHTRRAAAGVRLLFALVPCFAPVTLRAQVKVPTVQRVAMPVADWRRAWVGTWAIEFTLDRMRGGPGGSEKWRLTPGKRVSGVLVLADTLTGRDTALVVAHMNVDFRPMLGRPMSCLSADTQAVSLDRTGERVMLRFTPGAFDCGFGGDLKLLAREASGAWTEDSFAGPIATGQIRMTRRR
jgi:hypothetical protein